MLLSFIRHARRQSKAVRNQYALVLAVIFTGAVGSVWLYTSVVSHNVKFVTDDKVETSLPFSNLFKQAKEQWAAATEAVKEELPASTTEPMVDSRALILSEETISGQASKSATVTQINESESSSTVSTTSVHMTGRNEIEVQIATTSSKNNTDDATLAE